MAKWLRHFLRKGGFLGLSGAYLAGRVQIKKQGGRGMSLHPRESPRARRGGIAGTFLSSSPPSRRRRQHSDFWEGVVGGTTCTHNAPTAQLHAVPVDLAAMVVCSVLLFIVAAMGQTPVVYPGVRLVFTAVLFVPSWAGSSSPSCTGASRRRIYLVLLSVCPRRLRPRAYVIFETNATVGS